MGRHRLEPDDEPRTAPLPAVAATAAAVVVTAALLLTDTPPSSPDPPPLVSPSERTVELLPLLPDAIDVDVSAPASAARDAAAEFRLSPTPNVRQMPDQPERTKTTPREAEPSNTVSGSLRERVAANARSYVGDGIPYRYGGKTCTASAGCDCSALTWRVLQASGLDVGYRTSGALDAWTANVTRAQAQPGDLVFFYSPTSHVGIYVGDGMMVDHGGPGRGANLRSVDRMGAPPRFGRLPA